MKRVLRIKNNFEFVLITAKMSSPHSDDEFETSGHRGSSKVERRKFRSAKKGLNRNDISIQEAGMTETRRSHGGHRKKRHWHTTK